MPSDLAAVVARARELYASGHSRRQVVRAVFGADFPPEFFIVMGAVAERWDAVDAEVMCRAWEVFRLAEPDHEPCLDDEWNWQREARAAAQHPDVVVLLDLTDQDSEHGGHLVGYDLRELRAGRSTVVGLPDRELEDPAGPEVSRTVLGPSLVQVLYEYTAYQLEMVRFQATKWENIRYGDFRATVAEAEAKLRRADDLRRQAGASAWTPTEV